MNLFQAMKGQTLKVLTRNLDKDIGAKTYVKSALNDIDSELGKYNKLSAFNTVKRLTNAELAKQWRADARAARQDPRKLANKLYKKSTKGKDFVSAQDIVESYQSAADTLGAAKNAAHNVQGIVSTAIQSAAYSPEQNTFFVRFVGGDKDYAYPNATDNLMRGWINAGSKGKYFNRNVKRLAQPSYRGDLGAAEASEETVAMYQ